MMRCATIVAYVNGTDALLKIFSKNRQQAKSMINKMTIESFYRYIKKKHPAQQASRYLKKVMNIYNLM
ncbi:hypothetical protein [Buchnera aphidicola]|uniref:hypothetical protein n=1 Tax=Buchnera aphidicola TaxID=9 RepID=UPI0021C91C7D|nr:hypothetical protein [Buchnera aphidicola]